MPIDNNTYYPSSNITIFPSSNAVDEGKLFTEFNGRNITIDITDLNYVVSPNPGGYDISFDRTNNVVDIQPGKSIINGFEVSTNAAISYRLPTAAEIVNEGYYSGYALLCLHTIFDSLENISGNVQVGETWYCEGIRVEYVSYSDYNAKHNEYLLLGGVKTNGEIKENKDKYSRIDAKYILVNIESDPETNAPPTQSTDLLTFINNFLKGYWVSKAGDNEYGNLIFRNKPRGYLNEGFDYSTELPLDNTDFIVKIYGTNPNSDTTNKGRIVVKSIKDNTDPDTGIGTGTIIDTGSFTLYQGDYNEETTDTGEIEVGSLNGLYSTKYMASGASDSIYNNAQLVTSHTTASIFNLAQFNLILGSTPHLIHNLIAMESNKESHNGVETGDVIYATNEAGTLILDRNDVETALTNTINYLVDALGRIKTVDASNTQEKYVALDAKSGNVLISTDSTTPPKLVCKNPTLECSIGLANDNYSTNNTRDWKNVALVKDNLKVANHDDGPLSQKGGSIWAEGFIVAGVNGFAGDPSKITVPDVYNGRNNRNLHDGDIYGTQVWSAVYNDYAEIFRIHKEDVGKIVSKCVIAVDTENPDYHVLADSKNTCVVGVVSENPAYCAGGDDCEYGVPVALSGRVKVKYTNDNLDILPKIGDCVKASNIKPGYCTIVLNLNDSVGNIIGKIVKVIDENTVEIIVSLR